MKRGFLTASKADKRAKADANASNAVESAKVYELAQQVEQRLGVRSPSLITLPESRDVTSIFKRQIHTS